MTRIILASMLITGAICITYGCSKASAVQMRHLMDAAQPQSQAAPDHEDVTPPTVKPDAPKESTRKAAK